ncbi:MAG: hypothetical protein EOP87_01390 [Verrucomicrobiaceae bacterium]|nr:MAG: hypothetical protein EOP87_01390 [Verrucomicrobiaceae bacterium]
MTFLHAPPAEKDIHAGTCRRHVFSSSRSILPLLAIAIFCADSHAGTIHWGSKGYVENADSKGRNWDAGYTMGMGVFRHGFTPTFENRGQWATEWRELGTAIYDAEEKRFAGTVDTDAHGDVEAGTAIHFWAKNGDDLTKGPEWVLMTRDSWKWPAKTSSITPATVWTTDERSISLIVGDVGRNGKHLISRALRPVPVPESTWLAQHFGRDADTMAADLDPDGDGLPNALEYFLGSDPKDPSSTGSPVLEATTGEVRLKLARNPYAESGYVLEASEDLRIWFPVDHDLLTDRPDLVETSLKKDATKPALFFRFQLKPATK